MEALSKNFCLHTKLLSHSDVQAKVIRVVLNANVSVKCVRLMLLCV